MLSPMPPHPPPLKAIVPPEELAAEQDYRWRPNGRRSDAYSDVGQGDPGRRRDQSRGRSSTRRQAERRRRRRERQPEWDEMEDDGRGGRVRGRAGRESVREIVEDNDAAIEQLRRKQRQLVDREIGFQRDLEKVRRLLVQWQEVGQKMREIIFFVSAWFC